MDERETRAMMEDVAAVMKSLVSNAVTPIVSRLDALEKRLSDLPVPKDGKDANVHEIAALAAAALLPDIMEVRAMVEALPAPVEMPNIPDMISEALAESEGRVLMQCNAMVDKRVELEVAALPPAEKGKDADPVEVAAQIAAEVERAVAALPVPKDGKSITIDDVRPLIDETVTKAVTLIPVPKNGVDGKDGRNGLDAVKFFRDDKGHLIVVKSDGSTDDLGEYVGKDGKDIGLEVLEKMIAEKVDKIAPPEIERDAYLAEFAPDDVASNVSLAVKMMAALPHAVHRETRSEAHPINVSVTLPEMKAADTTVNVSLPEQAAPNVTIEPAVVNVSPAQVTIEARRSKEVTTVTGYDKNGRIKSFEKEEIDT